MAIDISVVILSWNDKEHLEECLQSLREATQARTMEVIVVDNASTDGSPDMVETRFPRVRLIRSLQNVGFPKGNNIGIQAASGKYLFLLNSDIKVLDGCMDALADFMDRNPDIGMAGPKIFYRDMTHQSSCRSFPSLWNNFCSAVGLAALFRGSKFFSGEHMFYFKGNQIRDVDVLVGCFWAVRRKAVDQFGLLDEGFFMYAEDVDWCRRCWKAGWRVVFFPEAGAIHYMGGSSRKDPIRCAITQQSSVLRYWRMYHGVAGRIGIVLVLVMQSAIRLARAFLNYMFNRTKRIESKLRMQEAAACLRAICSSQRPPIT
jgi:hypothetical protein